MIDKTRELALKVLYKIDKEEAYSNIELNEQIKQTQSEISAVKEEMSDTMKQIQDLNTQISGYQSEIDDLDFDSKVTSKSAISKAIANVGHDTELDKAPKAVYDDLPSCCLYDRG